MLIIPSPVMQQKTQRVSVRCWFKLGIWVSGFVHVPLFFLKHVWRCISAFWKAAGCLNAIAKLYIVPCYVLPTKGFISLCVSWAWVTSRKNPRIFTFSLAVMAFVNGNVEAPLSYRFQTPWAPLEWLCIWYPIYDSRYKKEPKYRSVLQHSSLWNQ